MAALQSSRTIEERLKKREEEHKAELACRQKKFEEEQARGQKALDAARAQEAELEKLRAALIRNSDNIQQIHDVCQSDITNLRTATDAKIAAIQADLADDIIQLEGARDAQIADLQKRRHELGSDILRMEAAQAEAQEFDNLARQEAGNDNLKDANASHKSSHQPELVSACSRAPDSSALTSSRVEHHTHGAQISVPGSSPSSQDGHLAGTSLNVSEPSTPLAEKQTAHPAFAQADVLLKEDQVKKAQDTTVLHAPLETTAETQAPDSPLSAPSVETYPRPNRENESHSKVLPTTSQGLNTRPALPGSQATALPSRASDGDNESPMGIPHSRPPHRLVSEEEVEVAVETIATNSQDVMIRHTDPQRPVTGSIEKDIEGDGDCDEDGQDAQGAEKKNKRRNDRKAFMAPDRVMDAAIGGRTLVGIEDEEAMWSETFPTIVYLNGHWHLIKCYICDANRSIQGTGLFKGVHGLMLHIGLKHGLPDREQALQLSIERRLSDEDVKRLRNGQHATFGPIVQSFGDYKRRDERVCVAAELAIDEQSEAEEPETPRKDSCGVSHRHIRPDSTTESASAVNGSSRLHSDPDEPDDPPKDASSLPKSVTSDPDSNTPEKHGVTGILMGPPIRVARANLSESSFRPVKGVDRPHGSKALPNRALGDSSRKRSHSQAAEKLKSINVHTIHRDYPPTAHLNGMWHQISCKYCRSNATETQQGITFHHGLRGLQTHVTQVHHLSARLEDFKDWCELQVIDFEDVKRISKGHKPLSTAFEEFTGTHAVAVGQTEPNSTQDVSFARSLGRDPRGARPPMSNRTGVRAAVPSLSANDRTEARGFASTRPSPMDPHFRHRGMTLQPQSRVDRRPENEARLRRDYPENLPGSSMAFSASNEYERTGRAEVFGHTESARRPMPAAPAHERQRSRSSPPPGVSNRESGRSPPAKRPKQLPDVDGMAGRKRSSCSKNFVGDRER